MKLEDAIRQRRSQKSFDRRFEISDELLREIFELVRLSPSSFNLQHWRFAVVRDRVRKLQLQEASYGQRHIGDASAVVVVAAKLDAHEDARKAQVHVPKDMVKKLIGIIEGSYAGKPQFQRDEAIRSASLAAMTLMLVARSKGLCSCPMIGFVPERVARIVKLPDGYITVMLVVLGKEGTEEPFPTSRFPLSETVKLETFSGNALSL
ncbi:MAG: nitroreductase family protein [Planctomycetota bacterium]|jgi:nitroreductase